MVVSEYNLIRDQNDSLLNEESVWGTTLILYQYD